MSEIVKVTGKTYRIKTGEQNWDEISFKTNEIDIVDDNGSSVIGYVTPDNMNTTADTIVTAINEVSTMAKQNQEDILDLGTIVNYNASFDKSTATLKLTTR